MTQTLVIVYLLFTHWVADFVVQTSWQAENKWCSSKALLRHILSYTAVVFVAMFAITFDIQYALAAALFNGFTHFWIDLVTSRINHEALGEKNYHRFFVGVGLDQALHLSLLLCPVLATIGRVLL